MSPRKINKNYCENSECDSDVTYCSTLEKGSKYYRKRYKLTELRRSYRATKQTQIYQGGTITKKKKKRVQETTNEKVDDNKENKASNIKEVKKRRRKRRQKEKNTNKDTEIFKVDEIQEEITKWKTLISSHIQLENDIREKISTKINSHMNSIQPVCSKTESTKKSWEKLCHSFKRVLISPTKKCDDYEKCKNNLQDLKKIYQATKNHPTQEVNIEKHVYYPHAHDHDYEKRNNPKHFETDTIDIRSSESISEMETIDDCIINDLHNMDNIFKDSNIPNINSSENNSKMDVASIEIDTDLLTPGTWVPVKNKLTNSNLDLLLDAVTYISESQQIDNSATICNSILNTNDNQENDNIINLDLQKTMTELDGNCRSADQNTQNKNNFENTEMTHLQLQTQNEITDETNFSQEIIQAPDTEMDFAYKNTQKEINQPIRDVNGNIFTIPEYPKENSQINTLNSPQMPSINSANESKSKITYHKETLDLDTTQFSQDVILSTPLEIVKRYNVSKRGPMIKSITHIKLDKNKEVSTPENISQRSSYDWIKNIKTVIPPSKHQFISRNILPEAFWKNPFAVYPKEWKNDFDEW